MILELLQHYVENLGVLQIGPHTLSDSKLGSPPPSTSDNSHNITQLMSCIHGPPQ